MFSTLGGAIGLGVLGLVARAYGIPSAWWCSAMVFALAAPGFIILGRLAAHTPALPIAAAPRVATDA
jgi:hypothetical protein